MSAVTQTIDVAPMGAWREHIGALREEIGELMDGLRVALERLQTAQGPEAVSAGPWRLDGARYELQAEGAPPVRLTKSEYLLVRELLKRAGEIVPRQALLRLLCDGAWTTLQLRNVDTHMARIRKKLGPAAGRIEGIYGVGYRFKTEAMPCQ